VTILLCLLADNKKPASAGFLLLSKFYLKSDITGLKN